MTDDEKPSDPALALVWDYAREEREAKYNRDRAIRIAKLCDRSVADIARAAGMSRQGVGKIVAKEVPKRVDNRVVGRKIKA